jgi:hypothetical protein
MSAVRVATMRLLPLSKNAPKSEEANRYVEWVGVDYDPERYDRHAANAAL